MLNAKKTSADRCGSLFAIVDKRMPASQTEALRSHGFDIIPLEACEAIPSPMASHTDMLLFAHKNVLIGSCKYFTLHNELYDAISKAGTELKIILSPSFPEEKYPKDALFNALAGEHWLFCKSDSVCPDILAYAKDAGLEVVSVKQGYPACTALLIEDKLAVTSDGGMAAAMRSAGIEVMLVPESDKISLPPYKNGFIGGCTAIFERNVFFFGNAAVLPYFDELKEKLAAVGYGIVSLDEESSSLLDLGGALLFKK